MQAGTSAQSAAGGKRVRYRCGETPKVRVKLVVNEPTLWSPTAKQTSATE